MLVDGVVLSLPGRPAQVVCDAEKVVYPARERGSLSPTSPGVRGYVLALVVSLLTLAVEIGVVDALEQGTAHDFVDVVIVVVLFGAVPAAAIGSIGAFVVHFVTRGASSQWPAVVLASAVGLVAGLIVWRGDFGVAFLLGVAAAVGRLVVAPCARRRTA